VKRRIKNIEPVAHSALFCRIGKIYGEAVATSVIPPTKIVMTDAHRCQLMGRLTGG
jgi:hypothetical protein